MIELYRGLISGVVITDMYPCRTSLIYRHKYGLRELCINDREAFIMDKRIIALSDGLDSTDRVKNTTSPEGFARTCNVPITYVRHLDLFYNGDTSNGIVSLDNGVSIVSTEHIYAINKLLNEPGIVLHYRKPIETEMDLTINRVYHLMIQQNEVFYINSIKYMIDCRSHIIRKNDTDNYLTNTRFAKDVLNLKLTPHNKIRNTKIKLNLSDIERHHRCDDTFKKIPDEEVPNYITNRGNLIC